MVRHGEGPARQYWLDPAECTPQYLGLYTSIFGAVHLNIWSCTPQYLVLYTSIFLAEHLNILGCKSQYFHVRACEKNANFHHISTWHWLLDGYKKPSLILTVLEV